MSNAKLTADQGFSSLLELLADCRSTEEFSDRILPKMCEFFSASNAVMHYYAGDEDSGHYYDPVYVNIDPHYLERFRDRYSQMDPFPMAALRKSLAGEGHAFSSEQLVDMDEFSKSRFYKDFLKPQKIYYMLVFVITRNNEPFAFLGIHRDHGDGPFSSQDIALANKLGPYLSAVADRVYMADELSLYKCALDTLSFKLMNKGVLVIDQNLTLVFANDYASHALAKHGDFNAKHRSVPAPIAEACQQLLDKGDHLSVTSNANFALDMEKMQINGYVRASQSRDRPLLFLAFLNSDEFGVLDPRACEEFGLTRREIEVTQCVVEGKANQAIADELYISVRTVQNHLRSIYGKCNVHNRTSLSNRMLSLV